VAPYPTLRDIPSREFPSSRSAAGARGDILGANSYSPGFSHLPWECIYLPLAPRPWFVPGHDPLLGCIYPREHPEVAWASRVGLLPTGAITMALKPPFSSLYYRF